MLAAVDGQTVSLATYRLDALLHIFDADMLGWSFGVLQHISKPLQLVPLHSCAIVIYRNRQLII
ncbi:hypothetical protein D3C71_2087280 [compost metagenome]